MVRKVFLQLDYRLLAAGPAEADFVLGYWQQHNPAPVLCPFTVLPDGSFKLLVRRQPGRPPELLLSGLWTRPFTVAVPAGGTVLGVRCKLPAAAGLLLEGALPRNAGRPLATTVGLGPEMLAARDLSDLARRVAAWGSRQPPLPPPLADLFAALYHPAGPPAVQALAAAAGWSARHLTRYFQAQFGCTPKTYADVLRSYAAVQHLRAGQLHVAGAYCDQSHGIRDVKKYTGATPGQLYYQRTSRYIQLNPTVPLLDCTSSVREESRK